MKKVIFLVVFLVTMASIAHAQNAIRKTYFATFIMPDQSIQKIALDMSDNGKAEYERIVRENIMNITPISLRQKTIAIGDRVRIGNQPIITESDAYRFLANQLCESCNVEKVLTKKGGMIFTKNNSGALTLIEVFWASNIQKWCIRIVPNADPNFVFTSTLGEPIFY